MEINKNNYEIFFIDYFDGKLSPDQVAGLFLFLEEHPELKNIFDSFENITLAGEPVEIFPGKENLKKGMVSGKNFNEYAIASIENELDETGKAELDKFLVRHPSFKRDLVLFSRSKLAVDESIVYPEKEKLKRYAKVIAINRWRIAAVAAAASIILIAGAYFILKNSSTSPSYVQEPSVKKEIPAVPGNPRKTDRTPVLPQASNKQEKKSMQHELANDPKQEPKHADQKIENRNFSHEAGNLALEKMETIYTHTISINISLPELAYDPSATIHLNTLAGNHQQTAFEHINNQPAEYKTPGGLLKQIAENKMESISKENDTNGTNDYTVQTPKKKFLDVLSWVVSKATFRKVQLQATYTPQGELMAYQLNVGNAKLSKDVLK